MSKTGKGFLAIKRHTAQLWSRLRRFLDDRAEKEKNAWGASLEYKRRYTNPDEAKRHRAPADKDNAG